MKKFILLTIGLILCGFLSLAVDIDVGLNVGGRSVADADIRDVYGNGSVYFPYVALKFWKGVTVGAGFEGGYKKDSPLGIYDEPSTLRVSGFELFVAYQMEVNKFTPYVRLGLGSYSYKQTIESEYVDGIDDSKLGISFAGGCKFYVVKSLFIGADLRYVPLKVKPLDVEVNLSGLRYSLGIGYTFTLKK